MKRAALLVAIAAVAGFALVFFLFGLVTSDENSNGSSLADNADLTDDNIEQDANNPVQVAAGIVRFEDAINLTNNPNDSVYGQVAAAGSNVYVVWQESTQDANRRNYDIFFKRSQDGGNTFENNTATNLSNNSGFQNTLSWRYRRIVFT